MALQSSVNLYPSGAVAGDRDGQNPIVYTPINFIAGAAVTVGTFVWRDTTYTNQAKNVGIGAPLGFVERVLDNYSYTIDTDGSLIVPQYGQLTVARRGDFYITADATATIGAPVYANTTTGAATLTGGANTVDTGYVVVTAGASGDLVIISNWDSVSSSNISGVFPITKGGTGLSALGTAGQVLTVNSDADAAEWATNA